MSKISAFALALMVIILSVKITLNFSPLYYYDINHLNISSSTNLNIDEIKSAYDYLIYYVNSSDETDFKIPGLPSSPEGIIHFKEVRNIFVKLNYLLYICLAVALAGLINAYRTKNFNMIKWSSYFSIIFTIAAAIPFGVNFDNAFTSFHQLFFSNNYWIFDPAVDPVINILPEQFFFHCAMLILLIIFTSSAALMAAYKILQKKFTFPS